MMKKADEYSYFAGEKSMEFLPLDVLTDQYGEPRIESYCTIARIRAATADKSGELELHHHLIVGDDWRSHTVESYTYYISLGSKIAMQDSETGARFELEVTSLENNRISLLVL
ncbi:MULTISPECIES: hypothetical protein [Treponema]|nr:hypothetical protein [Treponema sp.]MBQ5537811.1 hypothetical protein [Treponema sp.]